MMDGNSQRKEKAGIVNNPISNAMPLETKDRGLQQQGESDLPIGEAPMRETNDFITNHGSDNGGANDDAVGEVNLHGNPAFNLYKPIHQG